MNLRVVFFLLLFTAGTMGRISAQTEKPGFQPTFASLESSTPVPEWFKDAKFGIYFHWGVYSVPAFGNEWYPRSMYIKGSPEYKHHTEIYGDPAAVALQQFHHRSEGQAREFRSVCPEAQIGRGQFRP